MPDDSSEPHDPLAAVLDDAFDDDPLAGAPEDAVERVVDRDRRRSLQEAAVSLPGFDPIRSHLNETYGATFDADLSVVLAVTDERPLSHLVSFQPRVPNSPFDDEVTEIGTIVLFEDGSPEQVVAIVETYADGGLSESTIFTYEDEGVVERTAGGETGD